MRAETFTHETITATVRSRTRRTSIIEATYKQALNKTYPEIVEAEVAEAAIPQPRLPAGTTLDKLSDEQRGVFEQRMAAYNAEIEAVHTRYELGTMYSHAARTVSYLLARIADIKGAPFKLNGNKPVPMFSETDVLTAFDVWLDNEQIGEESFWSKLIDTIHVVDAPLTGPEAAPPGTLTEAEKENPLSAAPESSTKSK